MLGRRTYTADEIARGQRAVAAQLDALAGLDAAPEVESALAGAVLLALDRRYVHRLRAVAGKDGNPLNEVAAIADALLDHDGVVTPPSGIQLDRDEAVLGLGAGDRVDLTAERVRALSNAFFRELSLRFGE